jgi:tetratricopeptide (TPR) repeat protein
MSFEQPDRRELGKMKPNKWKINCLRITLVLFLLLMCAGCSSKEEKKAKHLEKAKEYIEKSEFKKAVIELKNVVQLDPKNDAAYYELGETYLKLKQGKEAFQSFARAVSSNPGNLKAQLKMGQIFLLGKRTEDARKKAELILEKSPDDIEALSLLSGVQVQENDLDSAITTLKKVASLDPSRFKTYLSLGRLFLLKRDMDQAEQAYLKVISLDPQSSVPYIELSRIYGTKGQWDKAESELKKMIETSGSKYQNLYVLGRFYESREKWDQAEKTYLKAVDSAPGEDVAPLMNLGLYYARRNSYEKALDAIRKASELKKDDLNILVSMAQLHFDFKKIKEAETIIDKVLEKDKGHVGANFLKGRIYLVKRDLENALERFNLVVRERPRYAMAYYFKALCLIGKGENKLAEPDLVKSLELDPRLLDARLILAETYLRKRDKDLARQQIEQALKLSPRHPRTLTLQGNLKILEQDAKGAEAAFKQVIESAPDYAPGYVRLGLLYYMTKRQDEALASFRKALEINPRQTEALSLMVGIYVRDKKYNEALQVCEKLKEKTGEDTSNVAVIEHLEGNIFLAKKDQEKARSHFEKAIKTDPNMLAPYVSLAKIYVEGKKLDQAISQYESVLNKQPKYLAGYMALGTIYDLKGDGNKAEDYYRRALEIRRDFGPAANNLAWNLLERGGNIDEALGFAQIAKEQMPKSAAVMDTLGWVYYLKGSYLNAIAELEDALKLDPDNPVINYHLGLAHFKNKQADAAKEFMEKALKIDQNFKGAEDARRILKDIKTSQ